MAADQFTKVTRQGWGKNILNSFIGAILGVLLFFGAFIVLWMNEGKINWAQVAASSTAVDSASVNRSSDGKLVSATGNLVTDEQLGDAPYFVAGPYLALERQVEMFAWQEEEHSETKNEVGGGSTTKTTYTYSKVWTSSPEDSSNFEYPEGHTNPAQRLESAEWKVQNARVGAYALDASQLDMPAARQVRLNAENTASDSPARLVGEYLFLGSGSLDNPQLGDLRIQYLALPNNTHATVFGLQSGDTIAPYLHRGESTFYRALAGDRTQAIAELQTEHNVLTWILRLAGFFMMWIGMNLVLGPITAFMNVLPFLGNLSGWMIGAVTLVIALLLSAITIFISYIAHNPLALVLVLLLFLGGFVAWTKLTARNAAPKPA